MKASRLYSILKSKCPVCHIGDTFMSKNIYDLKKFDKMPIYCSHCGHKFEKEQGFWYGAMYTSYALTVIISAIVFVVTYLIFPKVNVWIYIILISFVVIILAPITFRLSRMIWMNLFTKYDPSKV